MGQMALKGIRVADLTQIWAGPYCTKLLADFGAEVVKVEALQRPDSVRMGGGGGAVQNADRFWEKSPLFLSFNVNKFDITLDLTKPEAREHFKSLVMVSDVVIENFSVSVMENLGLSYRILKKLKPDIVMVSMPAFGSGGPYAEYRAMGASMEPMAGISHITGYPGGPPMRSGINYGDPIAGLNGAFAVLAALNHRQSTGQGQHIELSSTEALACLIPEAIMDYGMNHRERGRMGNRHEWMAPHGVYRCSGKDRWIAIAVANDDEWQKLRKAMGDPAWAREDKYGDPVSRFLNQEELEKHLETWTSQRDAHEVMHTLQAAGVAAGVVCSTKDLVENEHLKARKFFTSITQPAAGAHTYRDMAWRMSGTPGAIQRPTPMLGEHNAAVLQQLLGVEAQELKRMEEQNIIGTKPLVAKG